MTMTDRQCRDCGRGIVARTVLNRRPELRDRYACYGAHGMCRSCYLVAWRNDTPTEPSSHLRQERLPDSCQGCRRPMTTWSRLRDNPDLAVNGFVMHGARGSCKSCYGRAKRRGTLPDRAFRRQRKSPAPNDARTVARLRAMVGLPQGLDRHAEGEVTA